MVIRFMRLATMQQASRPGLEWHPMVGEYCRYAENDSGPCQGRWPQNIKEISPTC